MGLGILLLLLFILATIALISYTVSIYNSFVRLKNAIDKAWANIDVLLNERHDELPKLIDTCKGYMQYEQKTFQSVTEARSAYQKASTVPEKAQADNLMTGALKGLFAVAESYPELKADNSFMQLRQRITELEEQIADRREFFNDSVNAYNIRAQEIPDVIIARLMKLQARELFKATEEDRRDIEVRFA
jgi:LemA protein